MMFMDNTARCGMYPAWWLKTFPVKAFKLARIGYHTCLAAHEMIVREAREKYEPSANSDDQTFMEEYVEKGMTDAEILYRLASFLSAATDTVNYSVHECTYFQSSLLLKWAKNKKPVSSGPRFPTKKCPFAPNIVMVKFVNS